MHLPRSLAPVLVGVGLAASGCLDIMGHDPEDPDPGTGSTKGISGSAGWAGSDSGGDSGGDSGSNCGSGKTWCDGTCVDLKADPENCGACGTVCTAPTGSCIDGSCECMLDAICGEQCVSLTSNSKHCGSCDYQCEQGQWCHGGVCVW